MKKLNIFLIVINVILLILVLVKISKQEVLTEYKIDSGISLEDCKYELQREILYGEKSKYSTFNSDGIRENTSEELKKEKELADGLKVKDFKIKAQDGYTKVVATIENTSSEVKGGYSANLKFFNDEDTEVVNLSAYINPIEPNSETSIVTSIMGDIADVYRCEITKVEVEE